MHGPSHARACLPPFPRACLACLTSSPCLPAPVAPCRPPLTCSCLPCPRACLARVTRARTRAPCRVSRAVLPSLRRAVRSRAVLPCLSVLPCRSVPAGRRTELHCLPAPCLADHPTHPILSILTLPTLPPQSRHSSPCGHETWEQKSPGHSDAISRFRRSEHWSRYGFPEQRCEIRETST